MTLHTRLGLWAALSFAAAGCLVVPVAPDQPEWAVRHPPPELSGAAMRVVPLRVGSQWSPQCIAAGQASCLAGSEISYVAYLVMHPRGTFLIDAGLSRYGRADVRRLPTLGRLAFRYHSEGGLGAALAAAHAPPIDFVILTHAHWDHAGGLKELPSPRVVLGPGEAERVARIPPGEESPFITEDLAGASVETFAWDGAPYETFPRSHDWFGDGSVVLVPMPGHTPGSIGIFLRSVGGRRLLFVGDAAWSMSGIEIPSHKLAPFSHLTDDDPALLSETLWRLHHLQQLRPDVVIVPSHDAQALKAVSELAR